VANQYKKVPFPANVTNRDITGTQAYDPVPEGRTIIGTCVHRSEIDLEGTWYTFQHDRNGPDGGLTDYGVGGQLEIDLGTPDLDGYIYRFNDPLGTRSPYASGTDPDDINNEGAEGPGIDFENTYPGGLNSMLVSIELSGKADTPVTDKQFETLCHLIAYYHDQAEVPYDQFPNDPKTGVVTCLEHWHFARKDCPFPVVKQLREKYLGRAREIMKAYQTGQTSPPPPGESEPGDGDSGTPSDGQPGLFEVNDKIKVNVGNPINLRSQPSTGSGIVAQLPNGTEFCVLGAGKAAEGYTWYQVKTVAGNQQGYVAGSLCQRVAKNGCGTGTPSAKFAVGDRIKTTIKTKLMASPGNASTPAPTGELKETDKIVQASRGASETPIAYAHNVGAAHQEQVMAYAYEVYRLASSVGFDAAIIVSQSALETDNWRDEWWVNRLNPAGLGITNDPAQNQASQTFSSGVAAARAQLAHMHAYVYGDTRPLPSDLVGADARYNAVFTSNFDGTVSTINDLSSKWATVADYATRIVNRGNDIYGQVLAAALPPAPAGTKVADLTQGTELCVTDNPTSADGYDWYPVERYDMKGFVASQFTDIVEQGGCKATTPGPTPSAKFKAKDKVQVTDGPLNLRGAASTSAQILSSFAIGTELCITGGPTRANGYEWYQVSGGWVAGDFCTLIRAGGCGSSTTPGLFTVNDRIGVAEGPLNIRSTPTTQAAVVGDYATGAELCVLEGPVRAEVFEWYRVSAQGKAGWIAGNYCRLVTANGCSSTPERGRFAANDRIYIAVPELNFRAAPSLTASIINVLTTGAEACVVSGPRYADNLDWYRVRTAGREGWIAGQYAGLAQEGGCRTGVDTSTFRTGDKIRVADGPLSLRSAASLTGTIIATLPTWTELCVASTPTYANGYAWYQVKNGAQTGFIAGTYCELVATDGCAVSAASLTTPVLPVSLSGTTIGTVLAVNPSSSAPVRVRSTASLGGAVLGTPTTGDYLVVVGVPTLAEGHSWQRVDSRFGTGWVAADEVVTIEPVPTGRTVVRNPFAVRDTSYIFPTVSSSSVTRKVVDGNTFVEVANAGTQAYEGVRYESRPTSTSPIPPQAHVVGVIDASGSGTLNLVVVRVFYTDGTYVDSSSAASTTLSPTAWKRIVTPRIVASATKTVSKMELHVVRTTSAAAPWKFNTDNAKLILLTGPQQASAPQWTHQVTSGPLNLRTASNTSATVIGSMPNGTRLRIISGPLSNQGYSWYNVDAEGFGQGWSVNGFDPI
jgi:uncharacterized protein YgiM (DUF1202 family)